MTAVRAAAMLAAFLVSSAPVQAQSSAQAQARQPGGCPSEAPPPRRNPFGGLLAAARDAGLGQALVAQLGPSAEGQAAAALLSGDPASAVAAIPGARRDARTARATAAVAGVAMNMARSARDARAEACAAAAATTEAPPAAEAEAWN
ncbi:MAG TPA: hypothetical protein VLZ73_00800 [Brevundimonas sp.]|nr:hypothetical protein [Brevundimonas sp.]